MHYITVKKSDSVIIDYRQDNSVPLYWTVETLCKAVAADRGLAVSDVDTFSFEEPPQGEPGNFSEPLMPLQHCFDPMTGMARNNPAWKPPVVIRRWSIVDIRPAMTFAERVKWDNDKTDTIKTAKIEFTQPQELAHTTEVLQFLVDSGDISAATMQRILA